jgi:hypothetical protein
MVQPPFNPGNPKDRRRRKTPWWEIAAVAIAFGLLIANGFQGCQTKRASETATKELELSQRPWVSLDNFTVESPLIFDSNGAHVTIGFEIKNTGHSPGIRGFWQPDFFLQFTDNPSPVKKREDACKFTAIRSTKVTDSRIAETWFPGDPIPKSIVVGVESSDIAKALEIPKQMFPKVEHMKEFDYMYPDFVVCVAYRAAFTDAQYHTGYILQLLRTNPEMPYIPPMKRGEIPANELKLFVHPFYGIDAD